MKIHLKITNFSSLFIYTILVALATSPAFALGVDNRNIMLIAIMSISPLLVIFNFHLNKTDLWLIAFISSIILFPLLYQPNSMRWSTVLYSTMFCLTFMAYYRLLNSKWLTLENYLDLLKYLIYSYFLVLLIQQICVLIGFPIFNVSNYNPNEPWKLNSLASEPSHSARIVALLMFSYITIKELLINGSYIFKDNYKTDKWLWLAFIWCMTTMGSAIAFLLILIVLSKFLSVKNMIAFGLIIFLIFLLSEMMGSSAIDRLYKTIIATLSFDEKKIIEADHSSSMRIVPSMIVFRMIDLSSLDGWFGKGIDYTGSILSKAMPGVPEGATGGGIFQLAVEYGFISFIIFILFSFNYSYKKNDFFSFMFWFLLVFMSGVNNQIVWLCIILLYTNKYFSNSAVKQNKTQIF